MRFMRARRGAVLAGVVLMVLVLGGVVFRGAVVAPRRHASAASRSAPARVSRPSGAWGFPERSSLHLLRTLDADEARRTLVLGDCEREAQRSARSSRLRSYRRCAFLVLARTGAAAPTQGRMLLGLTESGRRPPAIG